MREFGNQAVTAWNSPWLPDHPLLGVEKADGSSRANTSVPPSDEELLKLTPASVHLNRTRHKDTDYWSAFPREAEPTGDVCVCVFF